MERFTHDSVVNLSHAGNGGASRFFLEIKHFVNWLYN